MTNKIKLAGIIGNPLSHSKSPLMHNYWLKKYDIKGQYVFVEVEEENLGEVIKVLPKMGFIGVSVTIPYKVKVMEYLDEISDFALKCGAVNAIFIDDKGKLFGDNTDGYGFITSIYESYPNFSFKDTTATVLGAGGAARSVVASLLKNGCKEVKIANRTIDKSKDIALNLGGNITCHDWNDRSYILSNTDVLINCTSLGQLGKDALRIDLTKLSTEALVTDIVYNPLKTDLIKQAEIRGNKTVTGIGMLIYQAIPAFSGWFKQNPEVTNELKELLLK